MSSTKEKNLQKTNEFTNNSRNSEFKFTTRDRSSFNIEKTMPSGQTDPTSMIKNSQPKQTQSVKVKKNLVKTTPEKLSETDQIVKAVIIAKKHIVDEISANFEEKLEKLDDAIAELISCKVENERLKNKIDNLTRENYKLKKEVKSYKAVMPGLFIKSKKDGLDL